MARLPAEGDLPEDPPRAPAQPLPSPDSAPPATERSRYGPRTMPRPSRRPTCVPEPSIPPCCVSLMSLLISPRQHAARSAKLEAADTRNGHLSAYRGAARRCFTVHRALGRSTMRWSAIVVVAEGHYLVSPCVVQASVCSSTGRSGCWLKGAAQGGSNAGSHSGGDPAVPQTMAPCDGRAVAAVKHGAVSCMSRG